MLDLSGLFLNRNPIANRYKYFLKSPMIVPNFLQFFVCFFRKIKHPLFWCNFVSKPQVRFTSVPSPFQVRSLKRTQSEGTTDSQRRENEVTAALWRLEISPQKKLFRDNPTFLHRHPI